MPPYKWPVVLSFLDWSFPAELPDAWAAASHIHEATIQSAQSAQSNVSIAVRSRDVGCRITAHQTATEVAHICPKHEEDWFLSNDLQTWNINTALDPDNLLNDMSNLLLLRSDLHKAFDDRIFVFFPKADDGFVVHFLKQTTDLGEIHHNSYLHPIPACSPRLLYVRFAWAIFPCLSGFLAKPHTSRLVIMAN